MEVYDCPHECCSVRCPKDQFADSQRWLTLHTRRFREHLGDPSKCSQCKNLFDSGEWTEKGGFDSVLCSHLGCNYFSICPLLENRLQAMRRHEKAFNMHKVHFESCGKNCPTCKDLVRDEIWNPENLPKISFRARNRLKNKSLFNFTSPDSFFIPEDAVSIPFEVGKKRKKKTEKDGRPPKRSKTLNTKAP